MTMQQHKRNTHSGSHANVAVNRAWKRAKVYIGPNRAARRAEMRLDAAVADSAALTFEPPATVRPS
jgi:hypothetical protein